MSDRLETKRWGPIVGGLGVVAVAAIAVAAWVLGFFTPEPEEVSLEATVQSLESDPVDQVGASTTAVPTTLVDTAVSTTTAAPVTSTSEAVASTSDTAAAADSVVGALDGTWDVVEQDATFVGYRADSRAGEAVGRSRGVTGTLEASGSVITAVDIVADMTRLQSDSRIRDDHLGDEGVEYRRYPTSSFTLTAPIEVGTLPIEGVSAAFVAVGELTVRAITLPVTIDLEGVRLGDELVIVGSTDIELDDFGASISGTDQATMEFSLVFARA